MRAPVIGSTDVYGTFSIGRQCYGILSVILSTFIRIKDLKLESKVLKECSKKFEVVFIQILISIIQKAV